MTGKRHGGCQCGAVRYATTAPRIIVYACHCRECQKQSASAFALSIPLRANSFEHSGDLLSYDRATDSGSRTHCRFCASCGTRVFHQSQRTPSFLTLKAGTLDDSSDLRPVAHLWVSRKQHWVLIAADTPCYDTQPDNLSAWREVLVTSADP